MLPISSCERTGAFITQNTVCICLETKSECSVQGSHQHVLTKFPDFLWPYSIYLYLNEATWCCYEPTYQCHEPYNKQMKSVCSRYKLLTCQFLSSHRWTDRLMLFKQVLGPAVCWKICTGLKHCEHSGNPVSIQGHGLYVAFITFAFISLSTVYFDRIVMTMHELCNTVINRRILIEKDWKVEEIHRHALGSMTVSWEYSLAS